ncbi:MAG: hypothetical protein KBA75_05245 [Alphaproteobacteria bacterium]|nr:hypothetical protein [Alphaproteobacteria bacterium]
MSLLEVVEEIAFIEAIRKNRGNNNNRNSYSPLKMIGALLCFEALSEGMSNLGQGLGALALGTAAEGGLLGGGQAAGSASAAAASMPIAKAVPKATPQPSLGLNLSPAAPGMSM